MRAILGINAFHPDASACLLLDGQLVAAVAEERLGGRVKHAAGFPREAVRSVLAHAGISVRDVDCVAIGHDNSANLRAKVAHVFANPIRSAKSVRIHIRRRAEMQITRAWIGRACGEDESECRFKILPVEHHIAHVASSFYASDFDKAAAFSYDGSGDFVSGMFARCEGDKIDVLARVFVPHSLGFFYTAVCQFIGFDGFGEEYKVMGLAAYGQPTYLDLMREIARPMPDGSYRLSGDYFQPVRKSFDECISSTGEIVLPALYSEKLVRKLGRPRQRGAEFTERDYDLAASCQRHFEDLVMNSMARLHREVGCADLVTAGGCALNGVCNARILRDTEFRRSYIQCAASDDGTAIGAALYVWNVVLKQARSPLIEHAYWGPEYSLAELETAVNEANVPYDRFEETALLERVAWHLNAGHVVGWYQGRSEWGPRALGNRSILAHPGWPGMKDLINTKIKRREAFRPFAPTILAEAVAEYFEQDIESPFMMHVVKIRPEKRRELSAVCHEDDTGRLHTVKRSQNRRYYDLISAFARLSGIPVVLNTSFNENEPIVDRPVQALECFLRTDIDVLALGPFVMAKEGKKYKPGK